MESSRFIRTSGRLLKLSHLDKVLYPAVNFTKADVIDYYRRAGAVIVPYIRNHAFTLKRYPDGVEGEGFYQKSCPSYRPGWIQTGDFKEVRYCLINDLPSLLWAVNLAAIELHTGLASRERSQFPSFMVFDLDPGDGVGISECAEAAFWIRDLLENLGIESYPKTSGQKGLHVCVPLNSSVNFRQSKEWSRRVAETLEILHPDQIVSRMSKGLRKGKVFIDWSQNTDFKSTVCVYSLRAADRPTVSTPLTWRELSSARKSPSGVRALALIGPDEALRRIRKSGDLFEPVRLKRQDLPDVSALELPRLRMKMG